MRNWKYITIIVIILLGGMSYFGYWAFSQYRLALDTYESSYDQLSASFATHTKVVLDRKSSQNSEISDVASTSPNIFITFPSIGDKVYVGCNYKITWEIPTTSPPIVVNSLDLALIDARTKEVIGPIASGLLSTSSEMELQHLDWTVGNLWLGEYYLSISEINDQETTKESSIFEIQKVPAGEDKEDYCDL